MRFSEDFIEELKSRLRPSEVIGRRVKLRRQGREFVGLSPFNKEKTPSFFVNDEKGRFFDFSSGKNGDIIGFMQETEGLSFAEAVERLAAEAGMAIPAADPMEAQREQVRKGLLHWVEEAQGYFDAGLRRSGGAAARDYLAGRGLPPDAWAEFGIGWAPDNRTGLVDHLVAKGAKPEELVEAGLAFRPENPGPDGTRLMDRFRARVMFPIRDPRGRLVGFGGRSLQKDAQAKYLNSPETPLFHKGSLLYRYPEARKAASDPRARLSSPIIAEGYLDVIAFARAGLPQAVAPLGTALTEEQLLLAWRAGPEPILCFDGDAAGKRAAFRAIDRALPLLEPGRSLRFALMEGGKDPDDLMREEGPAALRAVVDKTRPLVDLLWERELEAEPADTPERRAGLKRRLFAAANVVRDETVREEYRAELMARYDALAPRGDGRAWRQGQGSGQRGGRGRGAFAPRPAALPELKSKAAADKGGGPVPRTLLLAALGQPDLLLACAEELAMLELGDSGLERLRDAALSVVAGAETVDKSGLHGHLARLGFGDQLARLESGKPLLAAACRAYFDGAPSPESGWRSLYATIDVRRATKIEGAHARRAAIEDFTAETQMRQRGAFDFKYRARAGGQDDEETAAGRSARTALETVNEEERGKEG